VFLGLKVERCGVLVLLRWAMRRRMLGRQEGINRGGHLIA
jgi:hypothetical protein